MRCSPGSGKNLFISETVRVVPGDSCNIVTELAKMGDQPEVSTLIEQELHRGVASETIPFGGFGETASPVTIAFA